MAPPQVEPICRLSMQGYFEFCIGFTWFGEMEILQGYNEAAPLSFEENGSGTKIVNEIILKRK